MRIYYIPWNNEMQDRITENTKMAFPNLLLIQIHCAAGRYTITLSVIDRKALSSARSNVLSFPYTVTSMMLDSSYNHVSSLGKMNGKNMYYPYSLQEK